MYQNKFNIGDKVLVTEGKHADTTGVVVAIHEHEIDESAEQGKVFSIPTCIYRYRVMPDGEEKSISIREFQLESIPKTKMEIDAQLFKESLEIDGVAPKFKVGDVMIINHCNQDKTYVIQESIDIGCYGAERFIYELTAVDAEDEHQQCYESALEFLWHDTLLKYHCTEGASRNGLPPWRGRPYNFYMFYTDFGIHGRLDYNSMNEYNDHTIPPMFMKHILNSHSIYERINYVLNDEAKREMIANALKTDAEGLYDIAESLKRKIDRRNLSDIDPAIKKEWDGSSRKFDFTPLERSFAAEIDKHDTFNGNIKDHYPLDWTNLQIMKAIEEAYNNATKKGEVKKQTVSDLRVTGKYGEKQAPEVQAVKGKRKYWGQTNGGMTIEFWYNFDLNLIETAYPLRMNKKGSGSDKHITNSDVVIKENAEEEYEEKEVNMSEFKIGDRESNDEAFFEMAGKLPKDTSGKCNLIIAVGANEKNIAHFHVFRNEDDWKAWRNGACLYFTENKYYDHSKNSETLTRNELQNLIRILKSTHKGLHVTNWQYLVFLWNDNNDHYEIPDDTPMPEYDYRTIKRYKEESDK